MVSPFPMTLFAGVSNMLRFSPYSWHKAYNAPAGSLPTDLDGTYGDVDQFTDLTGNGRHIVQSSGTSSYHPELQEDIVNGHDAIVFDGIDERMQFPSDFYTFAQDDNSIVIAFQMDQTDEDYQLICGQHATGVKWGIQIVDDTLSAYCDDSSTSIDLEITRDTNPHVVILTKEGTTLTLTYDGVEASGTVSALTYTFTSVRLGARVNNNDRWFDGAMTEVVTFDRALSAADRNAIGRGIAAELGSPWYTESLGIVSRSTNTPEAALRSSPTDYYRSHNFIRHTFKEDSTQNLQFVWYNGSFIENTPFDGTCDFFLRGEFYIDGERYPFLFDGELYGYLPKENGLISNDPLQVPEAVKGARGFELTERIAVTGPNIVWNDDGTINEALSTDSVLSYIYTRDGDVNAAGGTQTERRTISNVDTTSIEVGYLIRGTGINGTATVVSIDAENNSIVMNKDATATSTESLSFSYAWQWDNTLVGNGLVQAGGKLFNTQGTLFGETLEAEFGLEFNPATVNGSGEISDVSLLSSGFNYSTAVNIVFYRGWGSDNATEEFPGSGVSGMYTTGSTPSIYKGMLPSGADNDSGAPPIPYANSGIYANAGVWGAIAVFATVPAGTVNGHTVGDSLTAGGRTDPDSDYTFYQYLVKQYGFTRMAAQGRSAAGFIQNIDEHRAILAFFKELGHEPTHLFNCLGVNDFGASTNPPYDVGTAALNNMERVADVHREFWPNIIVVSPTMPTCRTTSTDGWITTLNQTAYNAAYLPDDANPLTANGAVQYFNDNLNTVADIVVDTQDILNDPTDKYKWRQITVTDFAGLVGTLNTTGDGIHWGGNAGQLLKDTLAPLELKAI